MEDKTIVVEKDVTLGSEGNTDPKPITVKDKMGSLYNKIMRDILDSKLSASQASLIIDLIKDELLNSSRQIYLNE